MGSNRGGKAYLVGAGPGDLGLVTLRAIECLRMADVVIHDRLINRSLLAYAPTAEHIDVGKESNHHPIPQPQINDLLVKHAQAGKIVVRLKGGDPFIFGRGGEEALALAEAGIPFEVVPGVTSAVAVPAYAGIPITHRGLAASAAIVTGHQADCKKNGSVDPNELWKRLAGKADTLVFLMGVTNLPCIVQELIEAGLSPQTPIALIEQGTCPEQKTVTGKLENICERAASIRPPAVIVVGEVVELRENIRWFENPANHPLFGLKILLPGHTMSDGEPGELHRRLAALGARVSELSVYQVQPVQGGELDQAIQWLAPRLQYRAIPTLEGNVDWDSILFPDELAVEHFFLRLHALGFDARSLYACQIAVWGEAVASKLKQHGIHADLIYGVNVGNPESLSGKRVLVLGCPDEQADLIQAFQAQGIAVKVVPSYTFAPPPACDPSSLEALLNGEIEAIIFSRPAEVHGLANLLVGRKNARLQEVLANICVICLTPHAAEAARKLGVRVDFRRETNADNDLSTFLEQIASEIYKET